MSEVQNSDSFDYLKNRVKDLEHAFLDDKLEQDISDFDKVQEDQIKAFRVLCHAELEAYFEEMAKKLLDNAVNEWRNNRVHLTVASILGHFGAIQTAATISTKIYDAIKRFERERIAQNNGIKEVDIIKLFKPLGIEKDQIDVALLSTLDSYGGARGFTVHNSAKTHQPIDPRTELRTVEIILDGLKDFDAEILKLIS